MREDSGGERDRMVKCNAPYDHEHYDNDYDYDNDMIMICK